MTFEDNHAWKRTTYRDILRLRSAINCSSGHFQRQSHKNSLLLSNYQNLCWCCSCSCCCFCCCYFWSQYPSFKVGSKEGKSKLRYHWHWVCLVVGGGGSGWWWLRASLVFTFGLEPQLKFGPSWKKNSCFCLKQHFCGFLEEITMTQSSWSISFIRKKNCIIIM